jgi:hypothetical protein
MRVTPWDKLWDRLHNLGIWARTLLAIAALYENLKHQTKFTNGLSKVFGGDTGVRQGCPVSPFLFGVFVEMSHAELLAQGPEFTQPRVHVPWLLFADDVATSCDTHHMDCSACYSVLLIHVIQIT